jgi:hypothetical protein
MSSIGIKKKAAALLTVSAAVFGVLAGTQQIAANADAAPQSGDVVGVGSDTLQYILDFGADGDTTGDAGYNTGKLARLISFDATADANARAVYGSSGSTPGNLADTTGSGFNPNAVLRAGQVPRYRPNGSGDGFKELRDDTGSVQQIQFYRSSSALASSDDNTAIGQPNVGHLHVVRLAKDGLGIAAAGGGSTHAVALSKEQLLHIYQCDPGYTHWNDPGIGGTSSDTIVPIVPQVGSGTRKTFLTDIGMTVDSNTIPTGLNSSNLWTAGVTYHGLGACVQVGEENDPYSLYTGGATGTPNLDAIAPISEGRLKLFTTSNYFRNPTSKTTIGAALAPNVAIITSGTPADTQDTADFNAAGGSALYYYARSLYVIFRESSLTFDSNAVTAANDHDGQFNGQAKNWANTLFVGGSAYFKSAAGQALIAAAGVTPAYADCGIDAYSGSTNLTTNCS